MGPNKFQAAVPARLFSVIVAALSIVSLLPVRAWSGGGTVTYRTGGSERARCRVSYSGRGGAIVSFSGTCATPSGTAEQSGTLRRTGPNSYSGSFYNSQLGVRGRAFVSVNGDSQTVSLRSSSGSATLSLRR